MKKLCIGLLSILFITGSSCSTNLVPKQSLNKQIIDDKGNKNLIGLCNKKGLQKKPYRIWFNKNYTDYKIDTATAEKLKSKLSGKSFILFMGTWCGDSRREVPRMFKLLEYCGLQDNQVKLVMLSSQDSTYKQSPAHEEKGLNIHRVPDLLVFDNQQEIGRIVESPVISLEKDLLSIASNEPYSPNYKGVSFLVTLFRDKPVSEIESGLIAYTTKLQSLVKNAAELNTYGYVLMAGKDMEKAGIVFKCNTILYPGVANVFDSMGDYYLKYGNKSIAKEYYQKTLLLEPSNKDAKKMLAQLASEEISGKF